MKTPEEFEAHIAKIIEDGAKRLAEAERADIEAWQARHDDVLSPELVTHFERVMSALSPLSVTAITKSHEALRAERDEWKALAEELRVVGSRISGTLCDCSDIPVDPIADGVAILRERYLALKEELAATKAKLEDTENERAWLYNVTAGSNVSDERRPIVDDFLRVEHARLAGLRRTVAERDELLAAATQFDFGGVMALRVLKPPAAASDRWRVLDRKGYYVDPSAPDCSRDEAIAIARELAAKEAER